MGIKSYRVDNVLYKKPQMKHYPRLAQDVRDLVDYTVGEFLKPNSVLKLRHISFSKWRFRIAATLSPKIADLWFLSWSDLVLLRDACERQELADVLKIVYGITDRQFARLEIFNAFAAYRWILGQLVEIRNTEVEQLGDELSQEEIAAGAEQLSDFGYMVAVDALAHKDLLKHEEILAIPYAVIFRKLCLDKKHSDINKNYHENARRQLKANSGR